MRNEKIIDFVDPIDPDCENTAYFVDITRCIVMVLLHTYLVTQEIS